MATDNALRDYADADTLKEKETALQHALDLGKFLLNVVEPLARWSVREGLAEAVKEQANRLIDLARPWVEKHPAMFPRKPDHTLQILDILDGIETKIRTIKNDVDRLTKRRNDRAEILIAGKDAA